jgi:hypothetical protein
MRISCAAAMAGFLIAKATPTDLDIFPESFEWNS